MSGWQPWFPLGESHARRARALLEGMLDGVSSRWFGPRHVFQVGAVRKLSALETKERVVAARSRHGGSVLVLADRESAMAIGMAILRYEGEPSSDHGAESGVLEAIGRNFIDDLTAQAAAAAQQGRASQAPLSSEEEMPPFGQSVVVTLKMPAGAQQISVLFDPKVLLRPFERRKPAVTRQLLSRRAAVAAKKVRCSAYAGRVSMAGEELRSLRPGDVLLLDGRVDQPLRMTIDDRLEGGLRAFPCYADGRRAVQLMDAAEDSGNGVVHGS